MALFIINYCILLPLLILLQAILSNREHKTQQCAQMTLDFSQHCRYVWFCSLSSTAMYLVVAVVVDAPLESSGVAQLV